MAEWYIQPCERCGGAMKRGQVMNAIWAHKDPDRCREIIEADLRTRIVSELVDMAERARTAPRGVLTVIETQAAVLLMAAERIAEGDPQ
jgi:hypothetical protein